MPLSSPVDGFRLAYDRLGSGPAVLLLHGWPGDRTDYRAMAPRLAGSCDLIVPDFRGFGGSDKHRADPGTAYSREAQARSLAGLIEELGLGGAVLAGYDVGSAVAQTVAKLRPDLVRGLVVAPPVPGAGERVLAADAIPEFWYQGLHRLDLAEQILDGHPGAIRAYLRHFWSHWSGPGFAIAEADLDHLVGVYSPPGAFVASVGWYRAATVIDAAREVPPAPEGRIAAPTAVLWPEFDPLFPIAWSDRLGEFFADVTLERVDGAGHFLPLEAPDVFAAAVRRQVARASAG